MYIDTSRKPDNYWKLCIQKQSSYKDNASTTVKKLNKNTFEKTQSDVITKVYVTSKEQYEDTKNFPVGTGHKLYLKMIQYGLQMILPMAKKASVCGRQISIVQLRILQFM